MAASRIRIVVTGRQGQVASALAERGVPTGVDIVAVGRPELDLVDASNIRRTLSAARPDAIVNAAAYTAVDQAERERDLAFAINATGAGEVAATAQALGVPLVQLSTDYVFDGTKNGAYVEDDLVRPLNVYGASKAAGETAIAAGTPNHAIMRTSWIYGPAGKNFVRTILRVAGERQTLDIVDDQHGAPTSALDIADAVIAVVRNLLARPQDGALRGIFHMTNSGEASWADVGEATFAHSKSIGGPSAAVRRITSADYPQAARRPANSRLDCRKIARVHGVVLPDWRASLTLCVGRIVRNRAAETAR